MGSSSSPYLPVKLLRCLRSAQKACSGGSSAAWWLGDAPVSNPCAVCGVEGVEGGCRQPPPPCGVLVRRSDRRWPPRWRVCGGVAAAREHRAPHSRAGWTRRLGFRWGCRIKMGCGGGPGARLKGEAGPRHAGPGRGALRRFWRDGCGLAGTAEEEGGAVEWGRCSVARRERKVRKGAVSVRGADGWAWLLER
jgi:hypothetical protein